MRKLFLLLSICLLINLVLVVHSAWIDWILSDSVNDNKGWWNWWGTRQDKLSKIISIDVRVYWDSQATQRCNFIKWGYLHFNAIRDESKYGWKTPSSIDSYCGHHYGSYTPEKSIDGNLAEIGWYPYIAGCYHWVIYDMGETKNVTKVRLYDHGNYRFGLTNGYDIYVGNNASDLGVSVGSGVLDTSGGWDESDSFSKEGRYVKIVSKNNASQSQIVYEFDAYGFYGSWVTQNCTTTKTLFMKNVGDKTGNISFSTANFEPADISNYFTLTSNFTNSLQVNEMVPFKLTFFIHSNVTNIVPSETPFSFDIIIALETTS